MITAAQSPPEYQYGIVGHQHTSHLPPLKQHVPQIVHSLPGLQNLYAKTGHSIIKSHPPQQAKAWQPTAPLMEPSMASDEHAFMAKGWRDGVAHQYSNPSWGGRHGAGSNHQRNMGGFLPAQTVLTHQVNKKRQAQQRNFRERRAKQRIFYTSTVKGIDEEPQRIRLVSRPTQRDIFWDEVKGQSLDPKELQQPSPPVTVPGLGEEAARRSEPDTLPHIKDRRCGSVVQGNSWTFSWNMSGSLTNFDRGQISPVQTAGYMTQQKNIPRQKQTHGVYWRIDGDINSSLGQPVKDAESA
ncbi:uncharacterized protein LOC118824186 [Colossoma macropomum]|uniref:uncharacterized protein LOC118824186 n=1 Tax=Colossoma macropomum TaxID=42526 RepID=UPI001864E535|nr:uncharacterized protein LOC118824186 [Colossoma macropomum]